jgi:hypothetical protein
MTSSNLPYYEALWSVAKTCEGISGFRRQFFTEPKLKRRTPSAAKGNQTTNSKTATAVIRKTIVDIIGRNDLEWVKICTMSENSMVHELAKQGWVDDSEDEDDDPGFDDSNGLLKQMASIVQASRHEMARYQNPTVRLVLTKLRKDTSAAKLLQKIRDMGVTVQTAEELPPPTPISQEVLDRMTADEKLNFSDTLNIDCSILLGFASDISHHGITDEEWHHATITEQIDSERKVKYMTRTLWPICGSRKLVCTREAANKMLQIVSTIATDTERARTALILGTDGLTREQTVAEFQKLTDYQVPQDWQIPLDVVDVDLQGLRAQVSPVLHELFDAMLEVNQSVFFFGWTASLTTITANGVGDRALQNVFLFNSPPHPGCLFLHANLRVAGHREK